MFRFIHTYRPLTVILLLTGLGLTGTAPGNAVTSTTSTPTAVPTQETRVSSGQWTVDPDHGPDTGGTVITLTAPGPIHFTQVSAGSSHSLAIGSDGNLYTWGKNKNNQLGRNTGSADRDENPGMVDRPAGVDSWTQTSAGYSHSMAIGSDGNLYTWGDNSSSQLGRDTATTPAGQPGIVTKPTGVNAWTQIITGNRHSMAIGSDGNLYTWGDNYYGQLGRGTDWEYPDPGKVPKPTNVDTWTQIRSGSYHSVAIGSDGNLYTWGDNYYRQLGRDTNAVPSSQPGMVTKPTDVTTWGQASTGEYHSLAIGSDGNLYTWGYNSQGQLGRDIDGHWRDANPGKVAKPTGVDTWIQAGIGGYYHSLAVGSDGNLYTWGNNEYGQLGRGTDDNRQDANPGKVAKPTGVDTWIQAGIGGYYHSAIVGSDGNLYTWGDNEYGQLGRDTDISTKDATPGRVILPDQITLTGVKFDQEMGSGLTAQGNGTWTVPAPAHAAGTVTITISWTRNGIAQPDGRLSYTYESAPVVTRTITFDTVGGSTVAAQQVKDGDKATRPKDPTRANHQFVGWFNGQAAYDFDQPVTANLTLKARWTRSITPKPDSPTKPADPASAMDPSDGILSETGSDTAPVLSAGLLVLSVAVLLLASARTGRRPRRHSSDR